MRETESLLLAPQNIAIRTNYVKAKIGKMQQNCNFRLCGDKDETINHISECSKFAQKKTQRDEIRLDRKGKPVRIVQNI